MKTYCITSGCPQSQQCARHISHQVWGSVKCKKCNGWMFIDEWNGWRWGCMLCDIVGRKATNQEIKNHEKSLSDFYERLSKRLAKRSRGSTIDDKDKSRSQV